MRLIDADDFKKNIGTETKLRRMICDAIDTQQTAFDVEKVVEQLEEASHWEEATFDVDGYCNDDSWEVVYLDKAIEIVKSGCI